MSETLKEAILETLDKAENPLTLKDIKREMEYSAVKRAYGVTFFTIGQIRKILSDLKEENKIQQDKVQAKFPVFSKKK